MTRQDQFMAEMAGLFAKYKIIMDIEEFYDSYPSAITFFSNTEFDKDGNVTAGMIDFKVGARNVDYTDFQ